MAVEQISVGCKEFEHFDEAARGEALVPAMLELAARMDALSRGEAIRGGRIAGDLGEAARGLDGLTVTLREIGFESQFKLFELAKKITGEVPAVVDAEDLLGPVTVRATSGMNQMNASAVFS